MDEEKNTNEDEGKQPAENAKDGVQSAADKQVEQLNADTERINQAIAENENAKAREKLGGTTEAGKPKEKPVEETDHEYRLRIEKEMATGKTDFSNDGN